MSTENALNYLETMWMELVLSYGDHPPRTELWFANIVNAYSGGKRFYHNLDHLATMIRDIHVLAMREGLNDTRLIEFATYFHDYFYEPGDPNNEQFSAEVAEKCVRELGFHDFTVERINELILMTKTHRVDTSDHFPLAARIMSDADMLILAAPRDDYRFYARCVRLEHYKFDNSQWYEGRGEFLRKMIKDGNIFHTETAKRLEQVARENLIWELDSLKKLAHA